MTHGFIRHLVADMSRVRHQVQTLLLLLLQQQQLLILMQHMNT